MLGGCSKRAGARSFNSSPRPSRGPCWNACGLVEAFREDLADVILPKKPSPTSLTTAA